MLILPLLPFLTQLCLQCLEPLQRTLQVFNDILRQHIWLRKVVEIRKALIFHPENIQTLLVPLPDLINSEPSPSAIGILFRPGFLSLVPVLRIEAGDKIIKVALLHRILLQREVDICPEIIDPYLPCLAFRAGGTLVKEDHIRLHALFIKDTSGQTKDCMKIRILQKLLPYGFTSSSFEEHVIRHNHGSLSGRIQDRVNVLNKVQLLVGAGRPELRAIVNKILVLCFPFFVRKCDGGFFCQMEDL